jgi:hypothetical protein
MLDRLKSEPAVIIGILAAAVLAVVQQLGGANLLEGSVVDWVTRALNPTDGWAIPIILGAVTRFFVFSPAKTQQIANAATHLPAGTPVDIGHPPEGQP